MRTLRIIHRLVFLGMLCLLLISCDGGPSATTNNYYGEERSALRSLPTIPTEGVSDDAPEDAPELFKIRGIVNMKSSVDSNSEYWDVEYNFSQLNPGIFDTGNLYYYTANPDSSSVCYYFRNGGPFYCEASFSNGSWLMFWFWLRTDLTGSGNYEECEASITGDDCFNYLFNSPDGIVNVSVVK